jgi:filamentous hemagglutinin family protein
MNSTLFVPKKDHFYDSFDVTFTCVIEDEYGNIVEINKTIVVQGIVMNTYEEYLEACNSTSDEIINIKAYIADQHVKQTSSSYGSLYLIDANGNSYYVYNPMYSIDLGDLELFLSTYAVGKEVLVSGKCSVYSGWHEFVKGASVYLTGESIGTNHELLKHFDATETFYSAYSSKDADTLLPYESKQVIINDCVCVSNDGRYIYFTIRDGQTQFLIYNQSYLITPEEGTAFFNSIAVGDTFNLKGLVAVYGGAYQIYLNTPDAIEITKKAEVNIVTPVE